MYLFDDKNILFVFDLFNFYLSNIENNLNEILLFFIVIFFIFMFKDLIKYSKIYKIFNKENFIFLLFLFQLSNIYIIISNKNNFLQFEIFLMIQILLFIQILKKYLFKFNFLKVILILINFYLIISIVFYYNNNEKNIKNYFFIYSLFINICFIFNNFNFKKQIKKKKNIILLILLNINILFSFYYYYYNFLIEILFKKTNKKIQKISLLLNYFLLFIFLCNLIIIFFHMKNNNNNNKNYLNKKIKINFSTKKITKLKYNLKRKLINHKLNINYLKTIKFKEKNIENLIKENNKLSKENKILKNKLNSFINENNKNYFNINDLNKQIKKLKTTISNNENDINYLYDELDNKDLEIKEYLKEKNNLLYEINEKENSIKILNEKINENNIKLTPEKYEIVKVVNYLNKFTFYLFKYKHKGAININDFKWKFKENENDFNNFKIPKDNSFNYQKEIDILNNKLTKKEDEYNKLNLNFAKLFNQKNIENKNLKFKINNISKYNFYNNNNIITNNINNNNNNSKNNSKKNIIDVSNIENFSDESNFVDNSEIDELINYNNNNNNNNKINNNNLSKIKEIVDNFIIQYGNNLFKLNLKLHFANLFKLLNLNEEEIYKILGKYRTKNINISIK